MRFLIFEIFLVNLVIQNLPKIIQMTSNAFTCPPWINEFEGKVTICDKLGTIIYLNNKAIKNFEKEGGLKLIGTNIYSCHPEPSRTKLRELIEKCETNVYYTIKNGERHLIHQAPLFENGHYKWYAEFIFDIPHDTITHIRG